MTNSASGLPILTLHLGKHDHVQYTLVQARMWNPNSEVHLLGDQPVGTYPYVTQYDIRDYFKRATEFQDYYVHFNHDGAIYELLCMQRWLVMQEFVNAHKFERVFIMDSDVLLYSDITDEGRKYSKFDLTLCHGMSAGEAYFNRAMLNEFADFLFNLYKEKNSYSWDLLNAEFEINKKHSGSGGISDMMIFDYFRKRYPGRVGESMEIHEGATFDHHINTGAPGFEMEDGIKKIYWNDNRPYGKLLRTGEMVRFLSLHFQGGAKGRIPGFFREPPGWNQQTAPSS